MIYVVLMMLLVCAFYVTQNQEYKKARAEKTYEKIYQKAMRGDMKAQTKMGIILENQGLYSQSEDWYLKAAEQGCLEAQEALCAIYAGFFKKMMRDEEKEFYWAKLAVKNGKKTTAFNLANIYQVSKKFKDLEKAQYWYKKSGKYGYVQMAHVLVEKDNIEGALKYLKKAEKRKNFYDPIAQEEINFLFGIAYSSEGKNKDIRKAKNYLTKNNGFFKEYSEKLLNEIQ